MATPRPAARPPHPAWTADRDKLPALPRRARLRAGFLAVLLLAGLATAPPGAAQPKQAAPAPGAPSAPRPAPPAWNFGERLTVRGCLRFLVDNYRDRQSDVDNHDWVRIRVENACRRPVRNLLVELLLVDSQGVRYGTPVWILGKGERLAPGAFREEDTAIPDPDSRVAKRFSLRVLQAEGLPRPTPAGEKPGEKKKS